ncbi:hypothetical protein TRIUR3_07653 [Triticum urartu]|uniref:Myb/SANT-like domain-containing protein n=1 Tax=Triticum urartu TaxID=4572 RepID=M8A0B4_TRIUA|nr:hypothetical protein TRIUR3_07653 [Triticum urartu]
MDEDEELVRALCEVSTDPRFRAEGGGFKNCYTQGIESLLAQRLPGRGIKASPHIDSRLKVLKRKFHAIKEMLASPGFSWDGSRKVFRCEKQRYDEYCKGRREIAAYLAGWGARGTGSDGEAGGGGWIWRLGIGGSVVTWKGGGREGKKGSSGCRGLLGQLGLFVGPSKGLGIYGGS